MVLLQTLRNHPVGSRLGKLIPTLALEERPSLVFSLSVFALLSALLLGGGTRGGFLSDAILELLAIPPFLIALSSLLALPRSRSNRAAGSALLICFAIALLPLLQLIPLPPWIWQWLPQRNEIVQVFDLVGAPLPWLPVSVVPNATWLSALSLLPPIAVFLCVLQLSHIERRRLSLIFLGFGVAAAMLGLLQVAQGPSSSLRLFAFTNPNEAVGFFANRNHFAALLYVLMLFAAAWATDLAFATGSLRDLRNLETSSIAALTASLLVLVVLIAAESITRSRAGLGLMIIGMFGAFALPLADRRPTAGIKPVKLIIGTMIFAMLLGVQFALYRILDRFGFDQLEGARTVFSRNTITAAMAYMPFGSGFGTFVPVYQTFERAEDTLANIYANHAHNDIAEISLEGGVIGMALMVGFMLWFALRAKTVWRRTRTDIRTIDTLLARAATIAIVLVILHSFVDYPLRTDAMMAVLAFSCALLIEPLRGAEAATRSLMIAEEMPSREAVPLLEPPVKSRSTAPSLPKRSLIANETAEDLPVPAAPTSGRWGEDVEWPAEWNKPTEQKPGGKKKADQ
jgi:O-antigen ligase